MTNTILQLYRETGSIKKTAATLRISRYRVERALDEAGIPRKRIQPSASKSICFDCANARADRCAFMAASTDKAEAVLREMGARYKSKIYSYSYMHGTRDVTLLTVLKCPKYREGDIGV